MEIQINLPATHAVNRSEHEIEIDLNRINAETLAQLVLHGLTQKIGDAAAGKKGDEALAAMQKVMDQLYAGEWTMRRAGSAARSALEKMMITKARSVLKKHVDGYAAMTAVEKDDAIWELIQSLLPAQRDAIDAAARTQLEIDKEQAKALKELDLGL